MYAMRSVEVDSVLADLLAYQPLISGVSLHMMIPIYNGRDCSYFVDVHMLCYSEQFPWKHLFGSSLDSFLPQNITN